MHAYMYKHTLVHRVAESSIAIAPQLMHFIGCAVCVCTSTCQFVASVQGNRWSKCVRLKLKCVEGVCRKDVTLVGFYDFRSLRVQETSLRSLLLYFHSLSCFDSLCDTDVVFGLDILLPPPPLSHTQHRGLPYGTTADNQGFTSL